MKRTPTHAETVARYAAYVMQTYPKLDVTLVKARGTHVFDAAGKKYLDFFPGWAVSGIGHCHPRVVRAISAQARTYLHVPNNFYHPWQGLLAERIVTHSFPGKVFFSNSGAEANECAIKIARKFGAGSRYEIVTMMRSFHGRTMACIAATGQDKVKMGFEPMLEGFTTVPFGDLAALRAALTPRTVAVMLELIQGEGGVNIAGEDYVTALRRLCDERNMLLIVDEVQTCCGRTGKMFAYQHYGVVPDIVTMAKSLGAGVPIGATLAGPRAQDVFVPGNHGSTYGGSPIVCAAALAMFEAIEKECLLQNTITMGDYLIGQLKTLAQKYPFIREIRGKGLMIGVELTTAGGGIFERCLENGLLINCTQGTILRIFPPMTVRKKEIDEAIAILDEAMGRVTP